jgi:molybdenum-dependent DNA-binding transcriptional regulator ModE
MTGEDEETRKKEPIKIPPELSQAAEELHLSYGETLDLLQAYNSVVARRSTQRRREFSVDDWKELREAIKNVLKKVYG